MALVTQVERCGPAAEAVAAKNDDLLLLLRTVGFGVEFEVAQSGRRLLGRWDLEAGGGQREHYCKDGGESNG